jgi:hypothetical protein
MASITSSDPSVTDVKYRYFLTDLVSNSVIAELPFTGVSYERVLKKAGSFTGSIPLIAATSRLNIYDATMPGRTGVYVMRNDVCVWGGIVWGRKYDQSSKTVTIDASEFTSYFYHRNVWQTLLYGSDFIGISSFSITNKIATVITEEPISIDPTRFRVGNYVKVTFTNPVVDGTHQIISIPSANSFTFAVDYGNITSTAITSGAVRKLIDTYDFVRDLMFQLSTDMSGLNFANDVIEPASIKEVSIISKKRDNGRVVLETLEDHSLVPGQEFEIIQVGSGLDGYHSVTEVPDNNTIVFELSGSNVSKTTLPGIQTFYVTKKKLQSNVATLTTHIPHGAISGQTVVINNVDSFFSQRLDENFNGRYVITSTPTSTTFTYNQPSPEGRLYPDIAEVTVSGGTVTVGSKAVYGTFGPYTSNSDLGITVGSNKPSGLYQDTQYLRGYELKSFGEILEDYSDNLDGFEYRIDCDYDFTTASFTRTLVLMDIENPNEVTVSPDMSDEERLGFNNLVFEFPGSISTFSVEESAEDAATRFFVEGNITDLSDAASQPYAVAADTSLLNNPLGKSWPLLDQVEMVNNTADETILYSYAQEYLYESKPPMGDFNISVNGSLSPTVGTYVPGQWCSLIIDDPFVLARLESDQEPRSDIIVRKINGYKVSVPDAPSFPETVDLDLITDWKVDKSGETAGLKKTTKGN